MTSCSSSMHRMTSAVVHEEDDDDEEDDADDEDDRNDDNDELDSGMESSEDVCIDLSIALCLLWGGRCLFDETSSFRGFDSSLRAFKV